MKKKNNQNQKVNSSETDFYFDDCDICKAMKEAEEKGRDLTESELLESFRKAKEKGAVVGGDFFDKEDKLN